MKRIYANAPTRWMKYCAPLMATLTNSKNRSPRQIGRRTKHLYDWMAHASNLAKGSLPQDRDVQSRCHFCSLLETQQHINSTCTHPPLGEMRQTQRRRINEFFMCYRHQHLPTSDRWVIPLLDYMEQHLWSDTEAAGDIWNGRWTRELFSSILGAAATWEVEPRAFKKALQWIRQLTGLLQQAQRALYRVRHLERLSKEAQQRHAMSAASWKKRKRCASKTLYAAWNIPYRTPLLPRRILKLDPPPKIPRQLLQSSLLPSPRWSQYSSAKSKTSSLLNVQRRPIKQSTRNEHRTSKWKLRKLRHFLLICR